MKTCSAKLVRLHTLTWLCIAAAALASVAASTIIQVHLGTNFRSAAASRKTAIVMHTYVASAPRNAAILYALRSESEGTFQQRTTTSQPEENDANVNGVEAGEF